MAFEIGIEPASKPVKKFLSGEGGACQPCLLLYSKHFCKHGEGFSCCLRFSFSFFSSFFPPWFSPEHGLKREKNEHGHA